ncbi:hypothetical protein TCAL_07381, partial [Tigriopus californicus]
SHWQLALDSTISLSFEVCANPKPSRLFWATPVFTLRPGQQSPDFNLIAHNVTRSKDNATCLVVSLEVKKLNRDLLGEYILVATNQYGIEDGVILVSQSHSGQASLLRFRSEFLPQSGRHILAIQPVIATDIGTWTCHALQEDPYPTNNNDTSPVGSTKTRHQHLRQKSALVDRKHNERDSWSLIVLPSLEEPHVFNGEGEKRYASSSVKMMGATPSLSRGLPSPPSHPAPSSPLSEQGDEAKGPEDATTVITVQEGDELTLLCAMLVKLKNQREASLKWNSPFFDTSSQFSKEFFVQNNADLKALISVVTLSRIEREGNQQDVACQGVGNQDTLQTALTVQVQYPPTFTISRTPRFGVPILSGMTVVLECYADVQPEMTGSWLKDEFPMASDNGSLIIDSVSTEDVGWYQCYITYNGEEYSSIGYFLNVKSPPDLPPQDSPREIQSALSQNMSEASFASLKTSESPNQEALDVVAKNVLYSERKNCSKALMSLMSEERYRQPRIHSLNNQSHWQLALDSTISLSFEVCANPKPSRLFWATPVFTLRPGQQSPDFNLIAHNVTRSKDNATCLVVSLEVKKLNRDLLGEYILVATNQYGIEDGVILVSQSHSEQLAESTMLFTVLYLYVCYATVDLRGVLGISDNNFKQEFSKDIFQNRSYYGQTIPKDGRGKDKPHGKGSILHRDGTLAYSGSWWRGYMHGQGQRYFANGVHNYTGTFHYNEMDGEGQIFFANGSHFSGRFRNNRLCGPGNMTLLTCIATHKDDVWEGSVKYFDHVMNMFWAEEWSNGTYEPSLHLYKKVQKNSSDVDPEVICRVHAIDELPPILSRNGFPIPIRNLETVVEREFTTIKFKLELNLEMVTEFSCELPENPDAQKNMTVHNPFSMEASEQCGIQGIQGSSHESSHNRSRRSLFGSKVVDGTIAYRGQVPWQAAITYTSPGYSEEHGTKCGGVIISSQHILTAAHCLIRGHNGTIPLDELQVKIGMATWPNSLVGQTFRVRKIYSHANFSDQIETEYTMYNDISVLVLERTIRFNKYVSPICLPSLKTLHNVKPMDPLTVSGFGVTIDLNDTWLPSPFLQTSTVFLRSIDVCIPPIHEKATQFQGHLCAGGDRVSGSDIHSDSCKGDSGGPLTLRDRTTGRFVLIGLETSENFHENYDAADAPNIYMEIEVNEATEEAYELNQEQEECLENDSGTVYCEENSEG